MLAQKLLGTTAGGLVFVGGATAGATSSTPSFSLTGLSGGVDSAPRAGDLVIAAIGFADSVDRTISTVTSGYTKVADLYANADVDTQLGVFYKYLTAEETTVQFSIGTSTISRGAVYVWRNASQASPLDVATTTAATTGNSAPNAPRIIPVTDGAVVVAVGVGASDIGAIALTAPSGMENFFKSADATTSKVPQIVVASVELFPARSYDPAPFGNGVADSDNSACAASLAIRPA
jgi:hypothetical protein